MGAKQYLEQLSKLDKKIQDTLYEIYRLRTIASSTATYNMSGDRVQTSFNSDKIGDIVTRIVELEEEVDKLTDEFADLKTDIYMKLNLLERYRHKEILRKKYIENKSIYTIAYELGMSDRGCKKAHKRALEEFEKLL